MSRVAGADRPSAVAEAPRSPGPGPSGQSRGFADSAPPTPQVLVLGGGLAGIAAAVRLAEQGLRVTLIETSRRLGGRATSHEDPATGQTLDNCQHVVMGCCTNLIDLYQRLGVAGQIQWRSRLHFFDKQAHHDVLEAGIFLPAPLHLSISMLRMRSLSFRERTAIARAMLAMLRIGPAARGALDHITFTQWLRQHAQPQRAIDRFWSVVIISALNQHPDRASAAAAIHVFQDGFLAHGDAYLLGTAAVPLRELYDPAIGLIESAGGKVLLGSSAKRLLADPALPQSLAGVELADGSTLRADHYISALPFDRLDKAADEVLKSSDPRLRGLDRFTHSPILGIHLWFDRPVIRYPHMIFVDSPLQWVFAKELVEGRKSKVEGLGFGPSTFDLRPSTPQYLHAVISAADQWVDQPQDAIIDMALRELAAYAPRARWATLRRGRVIKEKRATFAVVPGLDAIRPTTRGPVENLLLAGDWTATGWPATMEGAVRSGYLAAAQIAGSSLPADLPRSPLCRLLGA